MATDTRVLYRDNGTGWDVIGVGTIVDTKANMPAATAVPSGTRFFATDQIAEWISNGTSWTRLGAQAGETAMTLAAAATAGKILLQGQAWPATTGIYAELHALFGGSTLPDMRQRVPAGFKSGDSDFGTLLATGGEKTHTLNVGEMPSHAHRPASWASGYQFRESIGGASNGPNETGSGPADVTSAIRESATEAVGGGAAHNNLQPFIVVNFEAKL
jgi:microcystin-dependent protein